MGIRFIRVMDTLDEQSVKLPCKASTKSLYRELIKQTLINNDVRAMMFKGKNNFAKEYSHVYITKDSHDNYSMLVFFNDLETPLGDFYFDFTLDYAMLMDMIETDLFNIHHKVKTKYFEFRMY